MKCKSIVFILFLWCLALPGRGQAEERDFSAKENAASAQASSAPADAKGIVWRSYEEGLRQGKNEKKKIFLNFYADWCQYCKIMDMQTFRDRSVVNYLNENFVAVRVNSDQNRKLAADYKVTGLPVSWFVAENGESIGSQPGFLPPETLLPLLKYISTDSYKKMNFRQFMEKM
ncbi:MAG: thioredoxin family protein [Desulfobacterales bacterium]